MSLKITEDYLTEAEVAEGLSLITRHYSLAPGVLAILVQASLGNNPVRLMLSDGRSISGVTSLVEFGQIIRDAIACIVRVNGIDRQVEQMLTPALYSLTLSNWTRISVAEIRNAEQLVMTAI